MDEISKNCKIDCVELKIWLLKICSLGNDTSKVNTKSILSNLLQSYKISLNEDAESKDNNPVQDKTILDLRTYICATKKCKYHNNRQHHRITTYNFNKMVTIYMKIEGKMDSIVDEIIYIWLQDTGIKNPKIEHIKYVKSSSSTEENKNNEHPKRYEPIEMIFSKIDKMAEDNNNRSIKKSAPSAPGQKIEQHNSYRMTYGDINYLGANKAIFYFDRGIRGLQSFTNSMYPLKQHPKHKDIVIIDEIVFTSNCKCDSSNQHREMFPHYRVTCAVGLTCRARLNGMERWIYARNENAAPGRAMSARSMLIRYW